MDHLSSVFRDIRRKSVQNLSYCIFSCRPLDTLKMLHNADNNEALMKKLTDFIAQYHPGTVM